MELKKPWFHYWQELDWKQARIDYFNYSNNAIHNDIWHRQFVVIMMSSKALCNNLRTIGRHLLLWRRLISEAWEISQRRVISHYVSLFSTSEVQTLFNTLRQKDCPRGEKKALEMTPLVMKNIYLSEKFQNYSPSTAKFHIPV